MRLKFSSIPEYLAYGRALAEGRLEDARVALEQCLELPGVRDDPDVKASVIQDIGDVLCDAGNESEALSKHRLAVQVSPRSPVSMLRLAGFLVSRLRKYEEALECCDAVRERVAQRGDAPEAMRASRWEAMILAIEARCFVELGDFDKADRAIAELDTLDEGFVEHALEACELLVRSESHRSTARRYLGKVLSAVEASSESEDLGSLRSHIKRLLNA